MGGRENLTYLLRIKQNAEIMTIPERQSIRSKSIHQRLYESSSSLSSSFSSHYQHRFCRHNHFWECFQTLPLPSAHCIDLCVHKIRVERGEDPHLNIRPSINIFPILLFQQLLEFNWIFWHICIFVFKWRQGIYAGFNVHIPKSVTDLRDTRH